MNNDFCILYIVPMQSRSMEDGLKRDIPLEAAHENYRRLQTESSHEAYIR
jgi:type IV secretory pathway ATPase VirB11/archaellum biosynthesis ATPase